MSVQPMLPIRGIRRRRDCRLFDADGREVLVSMMCPKCHRIRPFADFGIRRMGDGKQRSIPWCRTCRGGYGVRADGKPFDP